MIVLGSGLKPRPRTGPKPITKFPLRHHIAAVYPPYCCSVPTTTGTFWVLYLSCYCSYFKQILKVGFWDHVKQIQTVTVTFAKEHLFWHHFPYQEYHSCYWPDFDQTFLPKFLGALIFSPGGACTARALEVGSVSAWVSECVVNLLCLNDRAHNCLIHLRDNSTVTQCTVHV